MEKEILDFKLKKFMLFTYMNLFIYLFEEIKFKTKPQMTQV